MKKIAYMIVALAMVAAPMAFAESILQLDGNIKTSGDWSTGFPIDDVGTIATNGVLGNGNLNTSTWGTYTINHTAGTLTGTSNHNLYNNTSGTYNQSGGNISIGAGLFANKLEYNFSAGTAQAANVEATNLGVFNQTGGSFTAIGTIRIYRVANGGIINLLGGTTVSTTAASAFDLNNGAVNVGGDFDMAFSQALLSGTAPLTFADDWTGSFTRDNYTVAEWQADLVAGTVNVGGTDITDANFDTWFSVANSGAAGSALTVTLALVTTPPEWVSPLTASTGFVGYVYSDDLNSKVTGEDADSFALVSSASDWLDVVPDGTITNNRTLVTGDLGTHTFDVSATNEFGSTTGTVSIVISAGSSPVWGTPTNTYDAAVGQEISGTLAGKAIDPEGGDITYALVGPIDWLSVLGDGSLTGTPTVVGTVYYTVTADDGIDPLSTNTLEIVVKAETFFTGAVDTDFLTAGNWDHGVPLAGTTLDGTINAGLTSDFGGADYTIGNVKIIVGAGGSAGTLNINANTLTAQGKGFIGVGAGSVGTVNIASGATLTFVGTSIDLFIGDADGGQGFVNVLAGGTLNPIKATEIIDGTLTFASTAVATGFKDELVVDNNGTLAFQTDGATVTTIGGNSLVIELGSTSTLDMQLGGTYSTGNSWTILTDASSFGGVNGGDGTGVFGTVYDSTDANNIFSVDYGVTVAGSIVVTLDSSTPIPGAQVTDLGIGSVTGGMELSWTGENGKPYGVETNIDLVFGDWDTWLTGLPGDGGTITVTNTIGPDQTFYRVISE